MKRSVKTKAAAKTPAAKKKVQRQTADKASLLKKIADLPSKKPTAKVQPEPPKKTIANEKVQPKTADSPDALFASLPAKQQVFVLEYLSNGFNATRAAVVAGFSVHTADSQGCRLLKDVKVAAVIAARTMKALAKREITAERVLDEIAKSAFRDPRRMFQADGSLVQVQDLDEENAASILGVDVVERVNDDGSVFRLKKIRMSDKKGSLELLGRHLQLFVDKVEHSGEVGVQLIHSVPRPVRKLAETK